MPKLTADVLYDMLLEIKHKDPNHEFCATDLLQIGNVDSQYNQLVQDGRIKEKHDIIGSFILVD